jgi:hypothetical protein
MLFVPLPERGGDRLKLALGDHEQHPDAHIESPQHFVRGHAAAAREQLKDWQDRPRAQANFGPTARRKNAGRIICDSPTRDVGDTFDAALREQGWEQRPITTMRREQFFTQRSTELRNMFIEPNTFLLEQHLARKRIAIRV